MEDLAKLLKFLHETEKFKSTFRKYPLSTGRKESSAEHSWRLSLMAFLVAEQLDLKIDIKKATEIAIVHDIAEAYCGDFDSLKIFRGTLDKSVKEKAEKDAIMRITTHLPKRLGHKILSLWEEYEDAKTLEAKYIKALDKIETTIQYIETDHSMWEGTDHVAGSYADPKVEEFPELRPFLKELKKELRKEYKKEKVPWKKEYDTN